MEKTLMTDKKKIMEGVRLILEGIGEDVERDGLKETPDRIARMYEEIFAGMGTDAKEVLSKTFPVDGGEMVIEKDITFYSMCEHHFMPFYGKAHIAYIPDGKVVGLSKLARTVEVYAKRPQLQEQLTAQIADALMEYLKPKGAIVMLEAEHMCMTMRGVKKPGSKTVTYAARGAFEDEALANRFFQLLK
jgi:GTP cyclohydrolase I